MHTTKIKQIVEIKPVTTKFGERYKYDLILEDGTNGRSSLTTSKTTWAIGDVINYTISNDQYKTIQIQSEKKPFNWAKGVDYSKEKVIKAMEFACVYQAHRGGGDLQRLSEVADHILDRFSQKWL